VLNRKKIEIIIAGGNTAIGKKNGIIIRYGKDALVVDWGQEIQNFYEREEDEGYEDREEVRALEELSANRYPDSSLLRGLRLHALCLTHGHEDHIGGWYKIYELYPDAPVITHPYTEDVLRMRGRRAVHTRFPSFIHDTDVTVGPFRIRRFPINHSIRGSCCFLIEVGGKRIFCSGDFKIWPESRDGRDRNVEIFTAIRSYGPIDCIMMDSTNAEKPGFAVSESDVGYHLKEDILEKEQGRAFVTTSASNIPRLIPIRNYSERVGRKLYVAGPSMRDFMSISKLAGWHDLEKIPLRTENGQFTGKFRLKPDSMHLPDGAIIFCTGWQGQPHSFLDDMASNAFVFHKRSGDVLVSAASVIPLPGIIDSSIRMNTKLSGIFEKMYLPESTPKFETQGAEIIRHPHNHGSGHEYIEGKEKVYTLLSGGNNGTQPKPILITIHGDESTRKILARAGGGGGRRGSFVK